MNIDTRVCQIHACVHTHTHHIQYTYTHILTEAKDGVVLHQTPGVVIQTVALIDQELTHISGRHVCWDLQNFTGPILTPHLHYLETHGNNNGNVDTRAVKVMF